MNENLNLTPEEQAQHEEAQQAQWELLAIMHEAWRHQAECAIITDENLMILLANQTMFRELGYEPDQVIGQHLMDFIEQDPDNAPVWQPPPFPRELEADSVMEYEAALCGIKLATGGAVPVDVRLVCFRCGDDAGNLQGRGFMVFTMRDMESLQPAIFGMMNQMPPDMARMMEQLAQAGGMAPGMMPPGMGMPPGMMPPGMMPPGMGPGHGPGRPSQRPPGT